MSGQTTLIIIGTGPAGCSAAITASMAGLHPILIELRDYPKRQPGETLHPGIEPILKLLGVWEQFSKKGFHRHRGIWHESQDHSRKFLPYGKDKEGCWLGFQVDRLRFSEILRARVMDLGGTILQARHLDGVTRGESGISGICADDREFNADFVLDASGRRSWLAQKLGLIPERKPPMQRVQFGWTEDIISDLEGQPLFRERRDGWDWLAPLGDGRCAWAKLRRAAGSSGIDFTWQIFRKCAGAGYFLLGDAACLMDPSAANGVLRALMSGIYAVHLSSAIQKGDISRHGAAIEYRRWIGEMFDRSLTIWRTTLSPFTQDFVKLGASGSSADFVSRSFCERATRTPRRARST